MKVSSVWVPRSCPNCGAEDLLNPDVNSALPAEFQDWETVRDYFIGIRPGQVFFSYYRCQQCNLLYCPWYFTDNQLDQLYAEMPDNLLGAEKSTALRTQSGYVDWFSKFIKNVNSYLELGPDIGLVTGEISKRYDPRRFTLIEPNNLVHQQLQDSVRNQQTTIIASDLMSLQLEGVDLSIGVHVFDHLINPRAQIRKLNQISVPNALLGVVVHNEKSLLRKILGKKWPPFCLQHPQLFNKESLTRIFDAEGWELVANARSVNHFRLNHIGPMAINLLRLPKWLGKLFPNLQVPIPLGNMISIYRKK